MKDRAQANVTPLERLQTVKLGTSRQVMIPKRIYDQAGLAPGDYLEVELHAGKIVYTPKVLVDKDQQA